MVSGNAVERQEATEAKRPARQPVEAVRHLSEARAQGHLNEARAHRRLNGVPAQQLNGEAGGAEAACSLLRSTKPKGVLIRHLKTTPPPTACPQECRES